MKISKTMLSKVLLATGFILCSQLSFAGDTTPILLPGDKTPPPPPPTGFSMIASASVSVATSASATISDTELAVYFDYAVGNAIITVYDTLGDVVYQESVDTYTTSEVYIPVDSWDSGIYTLTVKYGITTQRGSFTL